MLDKSQKAQSHFQGHSDAITALEVHVASGMVASAQRSIGNVLVCVWLPDTPTHSVKRGASARISGSICSCLQRLNCGFVGAASALAFSPDGGLLAVACQDLAHTILIFEWRSGTLRSKAANGDGKILCMAFSLLPPVTASQRLFVGGAKHFSLVEGIEGLSTAVTIKRGHYGEGVKRQHVLCVAPLPPGGESGYEFVLGLPDGSIGLIDRGSRAIAMFIPTTAAGPIGALTVVTVREAYGDLPPEYKVIVGGSQGEIKILESTNSFQPITAFNLYKKGKYGLSPMGKRGIRSLCTDRQNSMILYATAGGDIAELDINSGADINRGPIVSGHCRDQVFAMDAHPLRDECVTGGDDKTLRIWDLAQKKLLWMVETDDIVRAVAFSPNGDLVVAGMGGIVKRGDKWVTRMDYDTKCSKLAFFSYQPESGLSKVHESSDAADGISCMVFSPTDQRLYVGSLDAKIYIYDCNQNFFCFDSLKGCKEPIRSLDISNDGKVLTAQGEGIEVTVFNLRTLKIVNPPLPEDEPVNPNSKKKSRNSGSKNERLDLITKTDWFVRNSTHMPDCLGLFSVMASYEDALTFQRSRDGSFMCVGTADGSLKMFRYPSFRPAAVYKKYQGHSRDGVSQVCCTFQDGFVVSLGRQDRTMMQWKVVKPTDAASVSLALSGQINVHGLSFDHLIEPGATVEKVNGAGVLTGVQCVSRLGASSLPSLSSCALPKPLPAAIYGGVGSVLIGCSTTVARLNGTRTMLTSLLPVAGVGADALLPKTLGAMALSSNGIFVLIGEGAPVGSDKVNRESFFGRARILNVVTGAVVNELAPPVVVGGIAEVPALGFIGGISTASFSLDGLTAALTCGDLVNSLHVFHSTSGLWHDAVLIFSGSSGKSAVQLMSSLWPLSGSALFAGGETGMGNFQLLTVSVGAAADTNVLR